MGGCQAHEERCSGGVHELHLLWIQLLEVQQGLAQVLLQPPTSAELKTLVDLQHKVEALQEPDSMCEPLSKLPLMPLIRELRDEAKSEHSHM